MVLNTLPPPFRHFHSAWDSIPAAERTLEKLVSRLMVEEIRMGINDISMNAESALMVKKHFKKRNTGSNAGQRIQKKDKTDSSAGLMLDLWRTTSATKMPKKGKR
ncbi:hypothetical protein KM043_017079 [Ampulex compressa]|nr:hypothetical protein KM043_017079 [Ampulex compressa]